jgi:large subunit ribosomal protein L2
MIGNLVSLSSLKTNDMFYSGYYKNKSYFFYAKAAGTFCKIRYKVQSGDFFVLSLPSGFKKKLPLDSYVFLGRNSNILHQKSYIGNAGLSRKRGIRPTVRGVAMNPVDHPHGGRTKTNQPEVSPWG